MRLYEYEGKELFRRAGIPVPKSRVLARTDDLSAMELEFPVMIKAQVLQGGRGKAGLVKPAADRRELEERAAEIFARIAPHEVLLLEEQVQVDGEAYMSVALNDVQGIPYLIVSKAGGMDIEAIAKEENSGLVKMAIDPNKPLKYYRVLEAVKKAGFAGPILPKVAEIAYKLYQSYLKYELDLIEINPLLIVGDKAIAGDAKVVSDDYVMSRQPEILAFHELRPKMENDTRTIFVPLDGGEIGIISFGASSTMMLVDSIRYMGGKPANFSDVAGGGTRETTIEFTKAILRRCDENPLVHVALVNLSLVATPLDEQALGLVDAIRELAPTTKVVVNIRACGAATQRMSLPEAAELFCDCGAVWCDTLEDAIHTAIRLADESREGGCQK